MLTSGLRSLTESVKTMTNTYIETQIVRKGSHYEVYIDGVFVCSADTAVEAAKELDSYLDERRKTEEWMANF